MNQTPDDVTAPPKRGPSSNRLFPMRPSPMQLKRLKRAAMGFGAISLMVFGWNFIPATQALEQWALDFRYQNVNRPSTASTEVVIVDIDEQSIKLLSQSYGRWPWPRRIYKNLLEFLALGEPKGVFFDLMFTEAQQNSEDDSELAQASASIPGVSQAMSFLTTPATDTDLERLPLPAGFTSRYALKIPSQLLNFPRPRVYRDFQIPPSAYVPMVPQLHFVNSEKDSDGRYRRAPLLVNYGEDWFPSLNFAAFLAGLGTVEGLSFTSDALKIKVKDQPERTIPLDEKGYLPIHFYSRDHDFKREPLAPLIEAARQLQAGEIDDPAKLKVNPFDFKDKYLFIGASAAGLEDLKSTPLDPAYPGVMLHATALSNMLGNDFLKRTPHALDVFLALAFTALAYMAILFTQNPLLKALPTFATATVFTLISLFIFNKYSIAVNMAMPLTVLLMATFDGLAYTIVVEGRDKKRVTDTLSKYLPPAVISQMISSGADLRAEIGQKKELSILFSDIRGFTTLSERLKPEEVVRILNEYLGRMTDTVFDQQGTLDKFIGDAIMAFWGAPVADPEHAKRATRCALQMQRALRTLTLEWREQGRTSGPDLEIGIGINTGPVIVGNIGSDKKLDYTVIGDNVNLASRLEGLTKHYGVGIVIGQRTRELLGDSVLCRIIDNVQVKGKNLSVTIYEPLCFREDAEFSKLEPECLAFNLAFEDYEKGRFEVALQKFGALGTSSLRDLYLERCADFAKAPPADWKGVYVATSK